MERGIRVFLEETRRDALGDRSLDRLRHDRRLAFAKGDEHDAPRLQDRADAHRDRPQRDVLFAEEVARRILAGDAVECDESRPAAATRARFVEADVPGAADAEELHVDTAGLLDRPLVALAPLAHRFGFDRPVGNVHVGRIDVDVIEEMLPHEAVVTLQPLRPHGEVLVEIEGDDVREGEPLLAVESDEFRVDPRRRRAGGETEDTALAGDRPRPDQVGDLAGDHDVDVMRAGVNRRRNALGVGGCGHG